jgi:hypothetical protein
MLNAPIDPGTLATLLRIPRREIAVRCGVTRDWLRVLSRDPRHSRRVLIAVLEAALERSRFEETVAGGPQ